MSLLSASLDGVTSGDGTPAVVCLRRDRFWINPNARSGKEAARGQENIFKTARYCNHCVCCQLRCSGPVPGPIGSSTVGLASSDASKLVLLMDHEKDRRRLLSQTTRLDNSRQALLHLLQDSKRDRLRLEASRKAMIHIMGDLQKTTEAIRRSEQELREKQEQLVQAGKLAALGELTTGVAHELNNPTK